MKKFLLLILGIILLSSASLQAKEFWRHGPPGQPMADVDGAISTHAADTTAVHGITDTSKIITSASAITANSMLCGDADWQIKNCSNITTDSDGNITTTGVISGGIKTATYSSSQLLTAAECRGYVIYVTGAATITLPARFAGFNVTIITIGNISVSVDPNASDKLWLDGAALDDGDKATNTSTTGDTIVITDYSTNGFFATSNGWTDGGV